MPETDPGREPGARSIADVVLPRSRLLPDGVLGMDLGLTLSKIARRADGVIQLRAALTSESRDLTAVMDLSAAPAIVGVTGARVDVMDIPSSAKHVQEIDAAARGASALITNGERSPNNPFILALLGTGTAFALVRDGSVTHLGGTALGGGSFTGIASRIDPSLDYRSMIARAQHGDRRNADLMISDAYPEGIGRIGPDLTAAHLAGDGGSIDDVLAALLNLHGESIGQIAASRARISGASQVVLAGGFVHDNPALVASLTAMISMFGVAVEAAPMPAFAGAIGAAIIAAEART